MFRKTLPILLLFIALKVMAQYRPIIENYKQQAFQPEYAWQSKFLFDYDVHFYGLDLSIRPDTTFIRGKVTIGASLLTAKLDTFAVELIPEMQVDSAFLNHEKLGNPKREGDNLLFPVPEISGKGTPFSVTIYYHGTSPTGGFFSGVSTAYNKTWKKQVAWTLSEPFAAKTWFPVKQDLKDKADSAWIFLTVDSNYMAGSEGLLTRVVNLKNGKKRFEWKTHYPIDYYLLSFAVADYSDYSFYAHPDNPAHDSVLVQNFIYNDPQYLKENEKKIRRTAKFIELYVKLFGPYPFRKEKYGHCLTELHGGMEHQTMTTLGNFGFDLVAHELGHMWFGDNVTCADWSDIWVNEGFASYADYLANEYLLGEDAAEKFIIRAQQNVLSQPGGSVYVPEDEIYMGNEWRIFNGRLSYDKGAAILHMLRHEINNDTLFFRILKRYQVEFADSVATGEDFKKVTEEVTGKDYAWFFNQWYYGEGYPIFDISWYQTNDTLHMASIETSSTQQTPFFKMGMDYEIRFSDGSDTLIRLQQTENTNTFAVPLAGKIEQIVPDPHHWTLQKINSLDYVGIEESQNPVAFVTGPVPARQMLYVRFTHPDNRTKQIRITDIRGATVWSGQTKADNLQIQVSGWKRGIYVLRAEDGNHIFIRKIIR